MSQFGSSSYGSRLSTLSGLRATNFGGPTSSYRYPTYTTLGQLFGGSGFTAPTFDTPSVNPAKYTTSAQAPPSSFDPAAGAQGYQFPTVPGGQAPTMNDLSQDPILQQIRAAGQRRVQDARSAAMANSENALVGYGSLSGLDNLKSLYAADPTDPILGALTDANTAAAAAQNPDSTLRQLATRDVNNIASIDNQRNLQNLFYSSTRANDLGNEATAYRRSQEQAASTLQSLLGGYQQNVLDTQNSAEDQYLSALSGAYDRWLSMQSMLGGGPGGPTPTPTSQPTPADTGQYYNPQQGWVPYTPIARPGQVWYQ